MKPHRSGKVMPRLGMLTAMCMLSVGCVPQTEIQESAHASTVSVEDLLAQCAAAHERLRTLHMRGTFKDFRSDATKTFPISWDYERPDRLRIQFGVDLAVVYGSNWWTYESATDRLEARKQLGQVPFETAASVLCKRVPMWIPAILRRGKEAFEINSPRWDGPWKLQAVIWFLEYPCFVVSRRQLGGEGGELRIWIDQDNLMIRGWTWTIPRGDEEPKVLMACAYSEIVVNGPSRSEKFTIERPPPIEPPTAEKDGSVENREEPTQEGGEEP